MKCEICHVNDASISIMGEVMGVGAKELNICQQCAVSQGLDVINGIIDGLGFNEIFKLMTNKVGDNLALDFAEKEVESLKKDVVKPCEHCGATLSEIKAKGEVGCEKCYIHFANILSEVLQHLHRGVIHIPREGENKVGKNSAANVVSISLEISQKQRELDQAVRLENFEAAVKLRDEIALLKGKLDDPNSAAEEKK